MSNDENAENPQNTTDSQTTANTVNNQEEIHACVDVSLPFDIDEDEVMRVAHRENPANPDPDQLDEESKRAAAPIAKKWQPGRTLRVRFMGGDQTVRNKVVQFAKQWEQHCSIKLDFNNAPNAEIRVAFMAGQGSWSYIGTDNLHIPQDRPTMNFGWLTPTLGDAESSRVILHEFGHALGLIHEHTSPGANIPWNKPVVYNYYQGPPNNWSKDQVDNNLFAKYTPTTTQFTAFDKKSIMLYPIPAQFVTDPSFAVGINNQLSQTDKNFIRSIYP